MTGFLDGVAGRTTPSAVYNAIDSLTTDSCLDLAPSIKCDAEGNVITFDAGGKGLSGWATDGAGWVVLALLESPANPRVAIRVPQPVRCARLPVDLRLLPCRGCRLRDNEGLLTPERAARGEQEGKRIIRF